jgi:DnaJ-class molecular chaperone
MKTDYYSTLGVPRNADEKAIKAAYRKLARKYHPDLNPNDAQAEAKFKEVSEAHEVLSDPEKRKMYDQYGAQWDQVRQGGGFSDDSGGFDFSNIGSIFEQFFGAGASEGFFQSRRAAAPPRDIERTVEVTLEEIDSGAKRVLTYQTDDACKTCDGTGQVRLSGNNLANCPTCRGVGTLAATKKVEVTIPAGIQDGKKLRVPGRGSLGTANKAGDLFCLIREIPHAKFRRKGDDVETDVAVDYLTAILGGEIKVTTPRGTVSMKLPEATQPGQTFRLGGQGISLLQGGRGNLFAKVVVSLPRELTREERDLLNKLRALREVAA